MSIVNLHECIVCNNSVRNKLLAQPYFAYDANAADKLSLLHSAENIVLGVSWAGAKILFELFSSLSIDECCNVWGIKDIEPDWLKSDSCFNLIESPAPMWWIVNNIVIPNTIELEESLLFILFGLSYNTFPIVGVADIFHSYTWSEPFHDTFSVLNETIVNDVDRFGRFIWWDIFCQNQHVKGDVGKTFSTAIKQVKDVYFSIPTLVKPLALGRVWCLFELTYALTTPTALFKLVNKSRKKLPSFGNPLDYVVDVRDAASFLPADKDMLLSLMEVRFDGGCEYANSAIQERFIPLYLSQCLLDYAIEGSLEAIKVLTQNNTIDLSAVSRHDGTTLLHLAVRYGHENIVRFLLDNKVSVNCSNYLQRTPLHEASQAGAADMCQLLLENGADVDAVDDDGDTGLHMADNVEVINVLLLFGANPTIENTCDEFPPRIAQMLKSTTTPYMIEVLKQAEEEWNEEDDESGSDGDGASESEVDDNSK